MYNQNPEQKVPMSPRISFSNNAFLHDSSHAKESAYRDAPVSDFEFSVGRNSMIMTAEELFSKGRILPYKGKITTLRDELRSNDDGDEDESGEIPLKPPKNPTKLKGFLGLRKSRIGSKKPFKVEFSAESSAQGSVE